MPTSKPLENQDVHDFVTDINMPPALQAGTALDTYTQIPSPGPSPFNGESIHHPEADWEDDNNVDTETLITSHWLRQRTRNQHNSQHPDIDSSSDQENDLDINLHDELTEDFESRYAMFGASCLILVSLRIWLC